MTSPELSRIPIERRRRLAATIALFAVLFVAVGAVAATGPSTPALKVFVVVALVVAIGLGLVSWGITTSVKRDLAEQRLDAAIAESVAAHPALRCGCGHEHDPTALHITDEPGACAHDGSGDTCAHDCDTCVLAGLRASPGAAQVTNALLRPRPQPQPASGYLSAPAAPARRPRPTPTAR